MAMMDQIPPILHGPSDKEKKYDRQLRLWAANGQAALEDAHILLLNSGSGTVGVETLKNLVLPGMGKFTIADESIVAEADLGVNFFLEESSLGQSRAKCCTELLQELNPDVKGSWIQVKSSSRKRHSEQMVDADARADLHTTQKRAGQELEDILFEGAKYTLIIYTSPISTQDLDFLEAYGRRAQIPLFSIHSAGFYSYFQIKLPGAFPIVDTHPDTTEIPDLRLLASWPELSKFASDMTVNIDQLNDHDYGHIPYLVLLLHFLEEWKETRGGPPLKYAEKKEFMTFLAARARNGQDAENFDEASANAVKLLQEPSLKSNVREIFEYKDPPMSSSGSSFWIIADAVKQFYEKNGVLPLPGSVPDMKAKSNVYVELQNIYKDKARKDAAEVLDIVRKHPNGSPEEIPTEEVETFCKNAAFIKLIQGPNSTQDLQELANNEFYPEGMDLEGTLLPVYLALKATQHGPYMSQDQILDAISHQITNHASTPRCIKVAGEVARARGAELHNISALTGGMVAQEVIKIITKQYTPIDNICVFDGISSKSAIFKL